MIRYTIYYTGRVQGVGFRYTAARAANRYAVAGYVMNLADGRVQMVAEGEGDELNALVDDVGEQMQGYIADHTVDQSPATGEFGQPMRGAFDIRH